MFDHIEHVWHGAALGEIEVTMEAHVAISFVLVHFAHGVHLGQVHHRLAHADQLRLNETRGGVGPAGTRGSLVLYGGGFKVHERFEFKRSAICRAIARHLVDQVDLGCHAE